MNRILLILAIFASPLVKGSANDIILSVKDAPAESTYDLVMSEGGEERVIWTKTIPKVDGKIPYDWCKLVAFDRSADGILVFLERNPVKVELLQFDRQVD